MRYHNITKADMLNGTGLRVVLWVAGCEHHCYNCQNPITHNPQGGIEFDDSAYMEIMDELCKSYCSGITFSGGDPLHTDNRREVGTLISIIKTIFPDKTIWIYTGYRWEEVKDLPFMKDVDVLVDGKFKDSLKDLNYHWAGSTNQRVIDVQQSLEEGEVKLFKDDR